MHAGSFVRWTTGLLGTALLSSGTSWAQTDTCVLPTPISGSGSFAYDTTGCTTSGITLSGAPCTLDIQADGFFLWTAEDDGAYIFDTCVPVSRPISKVSASE